MFGTKQNHAAKNPLKIIIVGCGKVGATLVEHLSKEGNDITIIDKNAKLVQQLSGYYDVMGITGNGGSYGVLMDAGIESADLFISVTESDELNLLCCTLASQIGNCATIARVRNPEYSEEANYLREKLGLAMIINPEKEAAKEMSYILSTPTALEVNRFAHGQAELIKLRIPENGRLAGMSIMDFGQRKNENILVCAIQRGDEVIIPFGSLVIQPGDLVTFVASPSGARNFMNKLGLSTESVKNCMIIGGGRSAYYLATELIKNNIDVKIIERDMARCKVLADILPKATIINGDGTDEELLKEEGIEYTEAFVPLTSIDEENILLSLHARRLSNAKVITKMSRSTFKNVVADMNLDSVIFPRMIAAEAIIAYARAKRASRNSNIDTMYHLFDNRAEALEFTVDDAGEIDGKPLKDIHIKKDVIICFINRNGRIIYPKGNDYIQSGDTVMVVTTESGFNSITDILE